MKRPWPPLVLALLTAVAVHLLALAYGQLAASRQAAGGTGTTTAPIRDLVRDDTPELLEFSRQQPLEETLATVPLPPPSTLPPPPDLLPAATPRPMGNRHHPQRAQRQKTSRQRSLARRQTPRLERRSPVPRPDISPGAAAPPGEPALATATDPQTTLALLLEQARRGEATDLLKPEADMAAAYARLWERARPALALPAPVLPGAGGPPARELKPGLELRRLPLAEARRQARAAIPAQRQGVVLGDRLLLLWPEGSNLWLLRAPMASDATRAS